MPAILTINHFLGIPHEAANAYVESLFHTKKLIDQGTKVSPLPIPNLPDLLPPTTNRIFTEPHRASLYACRFQDYLLQPILRASTIPPDNNSGTVNGSPTRHDHTRNYGFRLTYSENLVPINESTTWWLDHVDSETRAWRAKHRYQKPRAPHHRLLYFALPATAVTAEEVMEEVYRGKNGPTFTTQLPEAVMLAEWQCQDDTKVEADVHPFWHSPGKQHDAKFCTCTVKTKRIVVVEIMEGAFDVKDGHLVVQKPRRILPLRMEVYSYAGGKGAVHKYMDWAMKTVQPPEDKQ